MTVDVDKDGNGTTDLDMFVHMLTTEYGERDIMEDLMKAFRIIDHDGKISAHGILNISKELGGHLSYEDLLEMIEEADHNDAFENYSLAKHMNLLMSFWYMNIEVCQIV